MKERANCCHTRKRSRKERLGELFDLDYDLLLYDITSRVVKILERLEMAWLRIYPKLPLGMD